MKKQSKGYGFISRKARAVAGVVAATGSSLALAVDDATVTAAQTAGEASVLNATTGLVAIVAVIVGVSIILALMKKA